MLLGIGRVNVQRGRALKASHACAQPLNQALQEGWETGCRIKRRHTVQQSE
jgi:hypothetical protein